MRLQLVDGATTSVEEQWAEHGRAVERGCAKHLGGYNDDDQSIGQGSRFVFHGGDYNIGK